MTADVEIRARMQDDASDDLERLKKSILGLGDSADGARGGFSNLQSAALLGLGAIATAAAAAGAAMVGFAAASVGPAKEFESQLAILSTAIDDTAGSMDTMREAALAVGGDAKLVGVNASAAADSMTNLYKSGLTTTEIFGDLQGYLAGTAELSGALRASVDLAAASELEMAEASKLAAVTLATFGGHLESEAARAEFINTAMNNFVQTANAGVTSVSDLADALVNVGPTASALGISIQDVNATLGILSTRGITGAQAGTALKSMLVNMQRQTPAVTGALKELNVSLFDLEGNMYSMPEIIGQLETAFADLTQEQKAQYVQTIAGTFGMNALNALLGEGVEGWNDMTEAIAKAATIQETAAARAATFAGAWEAFTGVIETLQIQIGSALLPVLEVLVRWLTGLAETYGPIVIQAFENVTGAITGIVEAVLNAGTPLEAFTGALEALGIPPDVITGITNFVTTVGNAIKPITDAVSAFLNWQDAALAVAAVIAGILLPLLPGLITAVAGFIGAVIAAAAPVAAALGAIMVAVALLRAAWETNFAGIRDTVSTVWGALQTTFGGIRQLLSGDISGALQTFQTAFQTAFRAIVTFIGNFAGEVGTALGNVKDAIFEWAGADSWQEVGANIVTRISEGLADFADSVNDKLAEWESAIFEWAGADSWQEVGANLVAKISEGLADFADTVNDKLAEWETAIFDWAGADSWQEVGTNIADRIATGLADFADTVNDTLAEWETAIFDWAGADSWQEVGTNIADKINTGLADFSTAVNDTLAEWETAIFDWANADSWGEVGENIIERISAGMESVIGTYIDPALAELEATIFEATDSDSWIEAGVKIFYGIGEGLSQGLETLSTWAADFYDQAITAINGIDWYSAGYDIMTWIIEGIESAFTLIAATIGAMWAAFIGFLDTADWQQIGQNILEGIKEGFLFMASIEAAAREFFRGMFDAIKNAFGISSPASTMIVIGEAIVDGVIEGLTGFADKVSGTISGWVTTIKDLLTGADWGGVGSAIVSGVAGAIEGAKGAIVGAAESVANAANNAFKAIQGIESPSKVWAAFGVSLMTGLQQGIEQGSAAPVAAVADVAGNINTTAVTEFVNAIQAIAASISPAMAALNQFMAFEVPRSVLDKVEEFGFQIHWLVRVFAVMAYEIKGGLDKPKEMAETISKIADTVQEAILALRKLEKVDIPTGLEGKYAALGDQLTSLILTFNHFAVQIEQYMLPGIERFASAAVTAMSVIGPAIENMRLLSQTDFGSIVNGWHLRDQIVILSKILATLIREFIGAALIMSEQLADAIGNFADAAKKVIGLVEDGIDAARALSEADFGEIVQGWHLRDQIVIFRRIVETMIREFTEAANVLDLDMGAAVASFTSAAGGVIGLVADGIAAARALSETDFGEITQGMKLADQIVTFRNILRTLVREFGEGAQVLGVELMQAAAQFAEAADSVIGVIADGLDAITELAEYTADEALPDKAAQFADDLAVAISALSSAMQLVMHYSAEAIDAAAAAADSFQALLDVFKPGVDALHAMLDYAGATDFTDQAWRFADDLAVAIGMLASNMQLVLQHSGAAVAAAAAAAADFTAILSVFKPGIDALNELVTYEGITGLWDKANTFAADLVLAVLSVSVAITNLGDLGAELITEASGLAGAFETVFDIFAPAIDALEALVTYEGITGLWDKANTFAADLVLAVLSVSVAMTNLGDLGAEIVKAGGNLAASFQAVFDIFAPAIDALESLLTYEAIAGLWDKANTFAADLVLAVLSVSVAMTNIGQLGQELITQAAGVSDNFKQVFELIKPGIEALGALAEYVTAAGLEAKAQQFSDDLILAVTTLANGLAASELATSEALTTAAGLAGDLTTLLNTIKPGVDAIEALSKYTSGKNLPGKIDLFVDDLTLLAQKLVDGLREAAGKVSGEAIAEANVFASALNELTGTTDQIMKSLTSIAGAKRPDLKGVLEYLEKTSEKIKDTLTSTGATVNGTVVKAAQDFKKNVEDMVAAVTAAIDTLHQLANANVPGGLQQALNAMIGHMNNTAVPAGEAGRKIGQAFKDGLEGVLRTVPGMVSGYMDQIIGEMRAVSGQGTALGAALMSGFAGGVRSGQGALVAAVRGAAQSAVSAAQAELKIASPSQVFAEIGQESIAGWALPFQDARMLRTAVASAAGNTAQAAATAGGGASTTYEIHVHLDGGGVPGADITAQIQRGIDAAFNARGITAENRRRMY